MFYLVGISQMAALLAENKKIRILDTSIILFLNNQSVEHTSYAI